MLEMNNLFKINQQENFPITVSKDVEIFLSHPVGYTQVCTGMSPMTIYVWALPESNKIFGYKTYWSIFNMTGGDTTYKLKIWNNTKGIILWEDTIDCGTSGGIVDTRFWNTEQIQPNDSISFFIWGGTIGTGAGSTTLGYEQIRIETIEGRDCIDGTN